MLSGLYHMPCKSLLPTTGRPTRKQKLDTERNKTHRKEKQEMNDIQKATTKLIVSNTRVEHLMQNIKDARCLLRKLKNELFGELAENEALANDLELKLALDEAYRAANDGDVK